MAHVDSAHRVGTGSNGAFLSTGICHWKSNDDRHAVGEHKPAYQALKTLFRSAKP
jgi:hypothetical protein